MTWTWQFTAEMYGGDNRAALLNEIHDVFRDGFGIDGWSPEGIAGALGRCNVSGLLTDESDRLAGYAFYVVPLEPLFGMVLLWEDAICLRKEAQGRGLSVAALVAAKKFAGPAVGWVGGRTQNPLVMRRYRALGPAYPFDRSYAQGDGPAIAQYLIDHIVEVKSARSFDRQTGICANVYRERILGDYPWSSGAPLERGLVRAGFNRANGDAVVVVSQLAADGTTSQAPKYPN